MIWAVLFLLLPLCLLAACLTAIWKGGKWGKIWVVLWGFELFFAFVLSRIEVANYPFLFSFAEFVGSYFPFVMGVGVVQKYEYGISAFLAIVPYSFLIKTYLFVAASWRDKQGNYQSSGFSPLSRRKNAGRFGNTTNVECSEAMSSSDEPKSMGYFVFFSLALWFLTIAFIWLFFFHADFTSFSHGVRRGFIFPSIDKNLPILLDTLLPHGDFRSQYLPMWALFCMLYMPFLAFFAGTSILTFRDWCVYFYSLVMRIEKR